MVDLVGIASIGPGISVSQSLLQSARWSKQAEAVGDAVSLPAVVVDAQFAVHLRYFVQRVVQANVVACIVLQPRNKREIYLSLLYR